MRVYSELLSKTVPSLPTMVQCALLEQEEHIDNKGGIRRQRKLRPVLQRYWWLLQFGYGVEYDRGSRIWQLANSAHKKRNDLVHYEVSGMPSVKATELWQHLEAILLLLIGPSVEAGRTVMPNQYELHGVLVQLKPLIEEFEERPFFKDKPVQVPEVVFPCPFENVDNAKYPTASEYTNRFQHIQKRRTRS